MTWSGLCIRKIPLAADMEGIGVATYKQGQSFVALASFPALATSLTSYVTSGMWLIYLSLYLLICKQATNNPSPEGHGAL